MVRCKKFGTWCGIKNLEHGAVLKIWNMVWCKKFGTWCGVKKKWNMVRCKKFNCFGFKMSYGLCNCVILDVTVTVWLFKVQFDCVILHDTICIQSWITKSGICWSGQCQGHSDRNSLWEAVFKIMWIAGLLDRSFSMCHSLNQHCTWKGHSAPQWIVVLLTNFTNCN